MVALAGLVYLPRAAVVAFGLALVFLHNLADGLHVAALGRAGFLWSIAHEPHFGYEPLSDLYHFDFVDANSGAACAGTI